MSPRRVVVLGNGMAGARLAELIRQADPGGDRVALTVIGAEPTPAYNRVLLSTVLEGSLGPESVLLHDEDWPDRHGVEVRLGTPVSAIDRARRLVRLDGSAPIEYDTLVLATGSGPRIPPLAGLRAEDGALAPGAVAFRTLADCERILQQVRPGAPVAVLGGGLLGLEAARGLAQRGSLVTVVHPRAALMERQLDRGAGRVLQRALAAAGIEFRIGVPAAQYVPGDGLTLADGTAVAADLLVLATGVQAETGLAADAGLAVDRGVVVDDCLRTSDPRIHALGDCAQHPGAVTGLVAPAWEQAAVLADLLTGAQPSARYRGTGTVTRLKARGVDLAALGETHTEIDDEQAEVVRLEDPARCRYAKLVVRDDRIAGAILFGVPDAAAVLTRLYDRRDPVPADRLALLLGRALPEATGSVADLPDSALICRCNSVEKSGLVAAWNDGARTVADLARSTRATTGCGGCRDDVAELVSTLESGAATA